jgi:hypothetical protein
VAKRKSNDAAKPPAAASKTRSRTTSIDGPPSTKKSDSATQQAFSPHEIGNVAGEIWGLLTNDGEQTLAGIKKSVDAPADIVLAAIGWLAREDKLEFATSGRTVKISLR